MPSQQSPAKNATQPTLAEAEARLKAATERHAAIVGVLSRLSTTPPEKRLAQTESKKAEREMREAKELVRTLGG